MAEDGNFHFDHHDLKSRILYNMKSGGTEGQLKRILKNQFLSAMAEEVIVLDRTERKKLFIDVVQVVFEEILGGFESEKG